MNLNYEEMDKKDFKKILHEGLLKIKNGEIEEISIQNIISNTFYNMFYMEEDTEFNGWECDWWNHFIYDNTRYLVYGCAWDGTISIALPEEEE